VGEHIFSQTRYPIFLLDTSTRYSVFARFNSPQDVTTIVELSAHSNEDGIDNAVEKLFPNLSEIGAIWLGKGPGSFVGLRSSFAYVRMLSMLAKIPTSTFFSSRMWRIFFGVKENEWFLARTNAKLFYAEKFTPEKESLAVSVDMARTLTGKLYFWVDSWMPQGAKSGVDMPLDRVLYLRDAHADASLLTEENLLPQKVASHTELEPIYGHALNFALAPPART